MTVAVSDKQILELWQRKGVGNDPPSLTQKSVTLMLFGSKETLTLPVYTGTKVHEVKNFLEWRTGVDADKMKFTYKQGCNYRVNLDCEEIARQVMVHGLAGFIRQKTKWEFPHAVIGAGHIGLKMAMTWLMDNFHDFVVFERRPEVGGSAWWGQANATSRLQTEVGVYHLEYHEKNGWPEWATDNPWPSRDKLIEHFIEVTNAFGIRPYIRFNTNVNKLSVVGKEYWSQSYELTTDNVNTGEVSTFQASSVALFPGNLSVPKRVTYPGESEFDGDIVYGISSLFDYGKCQGANVAIIGSGAFAVENVRTCVEFAAKKVYMICRRKTISMPRVVSWFINQSAQFIPAGLMLEAMSPMYDLIGVDQWQYYAVVSNEARTMVSIKQKSRFGIGDVYFLAMYTGYLEHIVDDVKRVSHKAIHLVNGRVLEDVSCMLKLLGFNGEFENDKLLRIKELYGWWVNKDFRRYIVAEPLGVDANNFGSTSFSPGAINWSESQIHFLYFPKDWASVMDGGLLPIHVADESIDRPAYVVEARHGSLTGITLGALVPAIGERGSIVGPLKRIRMWQIHPVDKFIEVAKREWDEWAKNIRDLGYETESPPYPYTVDVMKVYLEKEQELMREMEKRMSGG